MSKFGLPKVLLGRNRQVLKRRCHVLLIEVVAGARELLEGGASSASGFSSFLTISRARWYWPSRVAIYSVRRKKAVSISSATAHEASAGCSVSSKSRSNRVACSTTAGSIAVSSPLQSSGTFELLIRSERG